MLDVKLNIGRDDLRPRFYDAKFPIYDKGLKKSSNLGLVVLAFNPRTPEAEARGSLSSRLLWPTKMYSTISKFRHSSHQNNKAGEDVIEQVDHFPAPSTSRSQEEVKIILDYICLFRLTASTMKYFCS